MVAHGTITGLQSLTVDRYLQPSPQVRAGLPESQVKFTRGLRIYAGITRSAAARILSLTAVAGLLTVAAATSRALERPVVQPPLQPAAVAAPQAGSAGNIWQKRWWIEKTARLLRGGNGLGPRDDVNALLQLPEEEIARRFMSDIRFGDTILDFNMFYLGFKVDDLRDSGVYRRNAFDFSNAVAAAQALLTGGDYLKLFDLEGPFFLPPLPRVADDPPAPGDAGLSLPDLRRKAMDEVEDIFLGLYEFGSDDVPPGPEAYCAEFDKILKDTPAVHARVNRAFNDEDVFILMMRGHVLIEPLELLGRAHQDECLAKPRASANVKRLTAAAKAAFDRYYAAYTEILKFEPDKYNPRSVLEFRPFDLGVFNMKSWLAFGFEQSSALKNSSTNYNRRRGAYVLKHFFCDDLTPVGFEDPQEHVGGAHGSDTPCFACHFKLDPMAGFFRSRGAYFYEYGGTPAVVFDDGVSIDRQKYETIWRAKKGAGREWNTGYVRSPRFEQYNSYGATIADLSKIIRNAPEAKRCLMKRLFEYLVAEEQTIDGGYLDELTRKFEQEAAENSSTAMKNAIVRIVLSNTYHQVDADAGQCYDHAAGAKTENAPPCRVAFILQKNCAGCHAGPDGNAGLDLTSWIPAPDGKRRTFPHLGPDRRQIAVHETLSRIAERLSATDPAIRMPRQMVMPGQERQELFLWVQSELAQLSRGERR